MLDVLLYIKFGDAIDYEDKLKYILQGLAMLLTLDNERILKTK